MKGYYYEIDGDGKEAETKSRLLGCACKTAWYCCKEHQKAHWKAQHKKECAELKTIAMTKKMSL